MAKVTVDFGTGNTVIARWNETLQEAETVRIPQITTVLTYKILENKPPQTVHVIPSLIHYGAEETLLGDQVVSRGLAEHRDTFRWMKRSIARGATQRKRTAQGMKSPQEAGADFLKTVLQYAQDQLSFERDEFTFTAPTEAFEDFQNWLRGVAEEVGIRRLRMLDEPTACVLGYHGASRQDERFLVFDFGCGTLDVAAVRIDLASTGDRKAVELGKAGRDLGGMDIDRWIADDFQVRHQMDDYTRREYQALILRRAEETKIELSDLSLEDVDMTVVCQSDGRTKTYKTTYRRMCPHCQNGQSGQWPDRHDSCLGCLLLKEGLIRGVQETVDEALENAAIKAGMRRGEITRVLVTGGTTLVPAVRRLLRGVFNGKAVLTNPFDAVSRGGCRGIVEPILQHDYSVEAYDRERKDYYFKPLFKKGTEWPTDPQRPVKLWARGAHAGMTRIGLRVFEVSQDRVSTPAEVVFGEGDVIRHETRVETDARYICLNNEAPTFVLPDPAIDLERDRERFLCEFFVDEGRRLCVTVRDLLTGNFAQGKKGDSTFPLDRFPVVRL